MIITSVIMVSDVRIVSNFHSIFLLLFFFLNWNSLIFGVYFCIIYCNCSHLFAKYYVLNKWKFHLWRIKNFLLSCYCFSFLVLDVGTQEFPFFHSQNIDCAFYTQLCTQFSLPFKRTKTKKNPIKITKNLSES